MRKTVNVSWLILALVIMAAGYAAAQAPNTIMYQGRLTNASGDPITVPTDVTFAIYNVPTGGSALYDVTLGITPDAQGVFTVELGPLNIAIFNGDKLYLGLTAGADSEMAPRQLLTSAPYAIAAESIPDNSVSSLKLTNNSVTSAKIVDGTITNADIGASAAILASKIDNNVGFDYKNIGTTGTIGTVMTVIDSVTIECPSSGHVLAILTGNAHFGGHNTVGELGIGTTRTTMNIMARVGDLDLVDSNRYIVGVSTSFVAAVLKGSVTLYVLAMKESTFSHSTLLYSNLHMTTIFFPERY